MELEKIEVLLEKYNQGETSLEEENQLRIYFKEQKRLPAEWMMYRDLFQYYSQCSDESFALPKQKKPVRPKVLLLVAAAAALVFSLQLTDVFQTQPTTPDEQAARLAFEEFQIQMKTVSTHLNKGAEQAAYLDYWATTTQKLIK